MLAKRLWLGVAAISGASSVGLAAYGSHALKEHVTGKDAAHRKELWQIGNRFHMTHSLALLAVPMISNPFCHIAGGLFTLGMLGFSGSMYTKAYYGEAIIDPKITQA